MRSKTSRILLGMALLILALPVAASAQIYNRYYENDRSDRNELRSAIARLDNSSARLENDLNYSRGRSVLGGLFYLRERSVDNDTIVEVQNFRQTVRDLRRSVRGGFDLSNSRDEAMAVLDRGIWLDRYLRSRASNNNVDADLADIRSNLRVIADVYGLSMRYQ